MSFPQFPQLTTKKKDDPKGRSFTVHLVASVQARRVVPPASNGTERPVLLAYAGSPSATRAFTANLRSGLSAKSNHHSVELLRSLGYRYLATTPAPGQALVIAYLPDLFHLHPTADKQSELTFISAPPTWWLDRQERLLTPDFGPRARDYARAMAFVARLDTRSPLPIANDPAFHHTLYRLAVETQPWCSEPSDDCTSSLKCRGLDHLGLESPILCDVDPGAFADFLATVTEEHLPRQSASTTRPTPSLPLSLAAASQLSLF